MIILRRSQKNTSYYLIGMCLIGFCLYFGLFNFARQTFRYLGFLRLSWIYLKIKFNKKIGGIINPKSIAICGNITFDISFHLKMKLTQFINRISF